jgi:hypothetical protein
MLASLVRIMNLGADLRRKCSRLVAVEKLRMRQELKVETFLNGGAWANMNLKVKKLSDPGAHNHASPEGFDKGSRRGCAMNCHHAHTTAWRMLAA